MPWIGSKKIAKKFLFLVFSLIFSFIFIALKLQSALFQKIPIQDANQTFIVKKDKLFFQEKSIEIDRHTLEVKYGYLKKKGKYKSEPRIFSLSGLAAN